MSNDLIRLPSISDLTTSLNHHRPVPFPVSHPPPTTMWFHSTQNQPQHFYSPANSVRLYPLQSVSSAESYQDAPRSMADNFRFVSTPGAPRQRRKKHKASDIKSRHPPAHRHATGGTSMVNDPSVNYPIANADVPDSKIPESDLRDLKESVYPSIVTKKYSASALDPSKSHLMVYEYAVGAHWVIWDHDTGYVHLTGLWRAALHERALQKNGNGVINVKGNAKADIVKLLESTPKALHSYIKRVRGGFLKIQGTWVPFFLCKKLALRFCYYIRHKLVPIFGTDFPSQCLHPSDAGFGELRFDDSTAEFASQQVAPQPQPNLDALQGNKFGHSAVSPLSSNITRSPEVSPKTSIGANTHIYHSVRHETHPFSVDTTGQRQSQPPPAVAVPSEVTEYKSVASPGGFRSPNYGKKSPSQGAGQPAMTYSDMMDLVNASKCLQSLSQRSSMSESRDPLDATEPIHRDKMRINNLLS